MMKKLIPVFCMLIMVLSSSRVFAVTPAKDVIDQAEAARAEAAGLGYEWRETATLIKDARAALEKGLEADALKLAETALNQGRKSIAQGMAMKKNWMLYIPKL